MYFRCISRVFQLCFPCDSRLFKYNMYSPFDRHLLENYTRNTRDFGVIVVCFLRKYTVYFPCNSNVLTKNTTEMFSCSFCHFKQTSSAVFTGLIIWSAVQVNCTWDFGEISWKWCTWAGKSVCGAVRLFRVQLVRSPCISSIFSMYFPCILLRFLCNPRLFDTYFRFTRVFYV